jgi:hypothetical protein
VTGLIYIAGTASVVRTTGRSLFMPGIAAGQLLASTPETGGGKQRREDAAAPIEIAPLTMGWGNPHPLLPYSGHLRLRPTLYYERSLVSAYQGP